MRFSMVFCVLFMGSQAFAEDAMRDVKTANPFILLHPESQQAAAEEAEFCDERVTGMRGELEAMCGRVGTSLRLGAMLIGGGVVYASMFWTDLLGEMLQDSLEQADNRRLLDFAGLMHQGTLVGVQRFEDRIHQRFEELVQLGFLKPRW